MYIKHLIQRGEGLTLDFKDQINDLPKIAKTLVAFANTRGGKLLIGVKDSGRIGGMRTEEEFYMIESAAFRYCKPEVPFSAKEHLIDDKIVLEVDIPEGENKPYFALDSRGKGWLYVRIADENIMGNKVLLEVMRRLAHKQPTKVHYTEQERWLLHYLQDHETISQREFQQKARISYFKAQRILINLLALQLLDILLISGRDARYQLKDRVRPEGPRPFEIRTLENT